MEKGCQKVRRWKQKSWRICPHQLAFQSNIMVVPMANKAAVRGKVCPACYVLKVCSIRFSRSHKSLVCHILSGSTELLCVCFPQARRDNGPVLSLDSEIQYIQKQGIPDPPPLQLIIFIIIQPKDTRKANIKRMLVLSSRWGNKGKKTRKSCPATTPVLVPHDIFSFHHLDRKQKICQIHPCSTQGEQRFANPCPKGEEEEAQDLWHWSSSTPLSVIFLKVSATKQITAMGNKVLLIDMFICGPNSLSTNSEWCQTPCRELTLS